MNHTIIGNNTARDIYNCFVLFQVDVAGGMYFLDISIDIVSSLTLILTIGLSVDYSAHVGNTFMTKTGTRNGT